MPSSHPIPSHSIPNIHPHRGRGTNNKNPFSSVFSSTTGCFAGNAGGGDAVPTFAQQLHDDELRVGGPAKYLRDGEIVTILEELSPGDDDVRLFKIRLPDGREKDRVSEDNLAPVGDDGNRGGHAPPAAEKNKENPAPVGLAFGTTQAPAFASSVQQKQLLHSANIFGAGTRAAAGFGAAVMNTPAPTPPAAPVPSNVPVPASGLNAEGLLRAFYTKHDQDKLDKIPGLVKKYKGNEVLLFIKIGKKYNVQVSEFGISKLDVLVDILQEFDPDRVNQADAVLAEIESEIEGSGYDSDQIAEYFGTKFPGFADRYPGFAPKIAGFYKPKNDTKNPATMLAFGKGPPTQQPGLQQPNLQQQQHQVQDDEQYARTVANQSPRELIDDWIKKRDGSLEMIKQENFRGYGFLIDALFECFGECFGEKVAFANTQLYGLLRNPSFSSNALEFFQQMIDVIVMPVDYSDHSSEGGLNHFGAAIRLKTKDLKFKWYYIDTLSIGRTDRFNRVDKYLHHHGVLSSSEKITQVDTFDQKENECAFSMCYATLAIVYHRFSDKRSTVLAFIGNYDSLIIRQWAYEIIKEKQAIVPLSDWDGMKELLAKLVLQRAVTHPLTPAGENTFMTPKTSNVGLGGFGSSSVQGTGKSKQAVNLGFFGANSPNTALRRVADEIAPGVERVGTEATQLAAKKRFGSTAAYMQWLSPAFLKAFETLVQILGMSAGSTEGQEEEEEELDGASDYVSYMSQQNEGANDTFRFTDLTVSQRYLRTFMPDIISRASDGRIRSPDDLVLLGPAEDIPEDRRHEMIEDGDVEKIFVKLSEMDFENSAQYHLTLQTNHLVALRYPIMTKKSFYGRNSAERRKNFQAWFKAMIFGGLDTTDGHYVYSEIPRQFEEGSTLRAMYLKDLGKTDRYRKGRSFIVEEPSECKKCGEKCGHFV